MCFWKNDPKLPRKRKVSSHYEEEKAPVEFVSRIEIYYLFFYQANEMVVNYVCIRFPPKDHIETLP